VVKVNENKLKYTSLTYDDILKQVYDRFLRTRDGLPNHKFDNFRESSLGQTLIEIFAGTVDINNYYIQRRAEECYFDTAQLKSSVISLSRMFAYDMSRISPAKSTLKVKLEGDFSSAFNNNVAHRIIQIPTLSKFSSNGFNFVLWDTLKISISTEMYQEMLVQKESFKAEFECGDDTIDPIVIIQGDVKEKIFNATTNTQLNSPFQIYKIEDKSFSDLYGSKDIFHSNVTRVWVGETKDDTQAREFQIDRKSLLNWENMTADFDIDPVTGASKAKDVCLIRTANDSTVELLFGDDKYAAKGAITSKDNIFVQYLSTEGLNANTVGVKGDNVDFSGKIYSSNGTDITGLISFELNSNIVGGANEESMDSIKYSAPKIYYSLDRLVTKQDYMAYLKSLTTPINIKNAVAWGEQEETDKYGVFALWKMFNAVLFSCVASMYNLTGVEFTAKSGNDINNVVLDTEYDVNSFPTQSYFNIFIAQEQVNQLHRYRRNREYAMIKGNPVGVSVGHDIWETYHGAGKAKLYISYTSNELDYANNIDKKAELTVDIPVTDDDGTGQPFNNYTLASAINDALADFEDTRGYQDSTGTQGTNLNFGNKAFIGRFFDQSHPGTAPKLCIWVEDETDPTKGSFMFSFNDDDNPIYATASPCYVSFVNTSPNSEGLGEIIGLVDDDGKGQSFPNKVEWITEAYVGVMNSKIIDVVKDLESRSQTSVKNIYISPIIHVFNLLGSVVIKSLFDIHQVRVDIFNSLYEWFDINIDFNTEIYISNIIEIIEKHPGVSYVDVKIIPKGGDNGLFTDPSSISNQYYVESLINGIANKYIAPDSTDTFSDIIDYINHAIYCYLGGFIDCTNDNIDTYPRIAGFRGFNILDIKTMITESFSYDINNSITERSFYVNFVSPLYNYFCGLIAGQTCDENCNDYTCTSPTGEYQPNYAKFLGKCITPNADEDQVYNSYKYKDPLTDSDFGKLMQAIHRDLNYLIMTNMLDTHGNIRAEYDDDRNFIRGGYTLGSEIVQIELDKNKLEFRYQ